MQDKIKKLIEEKEKEIATLMIIPLYG